MSERYELWNCRGDGVWRIVGTFSTREGAEAKRSEHQRFWRNGAQHTGMSLRVDYEIRLVETPK